MAFHGVVHFEIPAEDPDKLSEFYTQLFDWKIDKVPMGDTGDAYYVTSTVETNEQGLPKEPGAINGGIYKRDTPEQRPLNYVNVESVDEYVEKARRLGAKVLLGTTPIPGMGYFAQLVDPQGNVFGLYQQSAQAA